MFPVSSFSGFIPQFSVSVSLQITNDSRDLNTNQSIDLTSESQNNSINGFDSPEEIKETKNSSKEWKYISPQWSKKQIEALLDAVKKYESYDITGEERWELVAKEVKEVRPQASAQTCRIKYNRITKDQRDADKKLLQEEKTAILSLGMLKSACMQNTELLTQDQIKESTKQTLKRKIEMMAATKISSEPPLKRQNTSLVTREKWNQDDARKLKEFVEKTDKVGKERWTAASQHMGNKTPEQCRIKWQSIKNTP